MTNQRKDLAKDPSAGWGEEPVWKILVRLAPPVMLSQLIMAMYNIVDSYFIGKLSGDGLTALSVIFPIQLIITAFAVGTGVGVNTYMARQYAQGKHREAEETAGTGTVLAVVSWVFFTILSLIFMRPYIMTSASSPEAVEYAVIYGNIVCIGSLGTYLEGIWSKVLQARGQMRRPMAAQIAGAVTNIILDPVLIFGLGPIPAMGVAGAALATVLGQVFSAVIVGSKAFRLPSSLAAVKKAVPMIYKLGYPNIFMQALYTVYIGALNMILANFSDAAVTVLGLYYKLQSFFFIPLFAYQTCIVPVLSFNYARALYRRCHRIVLFSIGVAAAFMLIGMICFFVFPDALLGIFSDDPLVHSVGVTAFRRIAVSFLPIVFSLLLPTFFQAIGRGVASTMLSLTRQIFCLVTLFWLFSFIGLDWTWFAFPCAEIITGGIGLVLYIRQLRQWKGQGDWV